MIDRRGDLGTGEPRKEGPAIRLPLGGGAWTPGRRLWALILGTAALRLAWAAALGPGNDEAYHALFVRHPDWSYFDHPPMVALVAWLGLGPAGGVASTLALRAGFVALFAGSTWLMARLASRFYGERAALLAALALNLSGYFGLAAGTFALPDGPLLFFWLLTLDRLAAALDAPDRPGRWGAVGLAWGGALLSKYHAVLLPPGALLFLLVEPTARPCLRRVGPYLALGTGLLLFAPVVGWNAAHGWASFAFQGGRAAGSGFRPDALAAAVGGQALYLFPWIWLGLVAAALRSARRFRSSGAGDRFLLCQAAFPGLLFTAVACVRPILPHWPLVGFLALYPLLGRAWASRPGGASRRRLGVAAAVPVALAVLLAGQVRLGWLQDGRGRTLGLLAPATDPTLDPFGWDQVTRELARRGLLGRPGTFLFTGNWYHSAQLAFALGEAAPVACYCAGDARGFAFWSRPEDWVGRDGVLVSLDDREVEPACFDRWFARIDPLGEFPLRRAGSPVRKVRLFRCVRQGRPFPFDALKAPAAGPGRRAVPRPIEPFDKLARGMSQ